MTKALFVGVLLVTASSLQAQESVVENVGPNPPSVKWYKINTPAGKIIFPAGFDSIAYRTAGLVNYQRTHDEEIVGRKLTKKVPFIIQHLSVFPEGFSTPAPWRNEHFTMPPQNLFTGPTPWMDYLTVHEYRHAQQFSMARGGFTWFFKIPMGQTGWLLNTLFNQPLWFREGDAVATETLLTKAGRGRMPRFHMETKALLLSGRKYDYEKGIYSTSFKDFVPNPYRPGFYMTMKARSYFGDSLWQRVLHDTYHKGLIYSFAIALKRTTGLSAPRLYQQTMTELDSLWKTEEADNVLTPAERIKTRRARTFTNYRFPHYLPDGSTVSLKDGFNTIRTFMTVTKDGKEKGLFPYGVYTDDHVMFAAEGNTITWAEAAFDERWGNKNYSIINVYDLASGKTKKLTRGTRYFAPAPSTDGTKIVAVEVSLQSRSSLVVLNGQTGKVIKQIAFPANVFIAQPRFTEDGNRVVIIAISNKGNSLIEINIDDEKQQTLLDYTTVPVSRPYPKGDYVYFSAGYTGTDNIYALERSTKNIYQITSVRSGAYEPVVPPDNKKLLYSSYTADGYRLEEIILDKTKWKPIHSFKDAPYQYPYVGDIKNNDLTDSVFLASYKASRYRAFTEGLFNFHSLFPYIGTDQYGLEFSTQNIMHTLQATVTPFYNTNEKAFGLKANLAYAAFYPVVHLQTGYQTRSTARIIGHINPIVYEQDWKEQYLSAGIVFPLRLTQGAYDSRLQMGGYIKHYNTDFLDSLKPEIKFRNLRFDAYGVQASFSRLLQKARQHVKPRWGQTVNVDFQKAWKEMPERTFITAQLFFPGFLNNHSLNMVVAWKKEAVVNTYRFADNFMMPRGYKPSPFEKIHVVTVNYEMPLYYPDLSLGGFAFLQRLRSTLFFDYARAERLQENYTLNTCGAEVLLDMRLLRLFGMTMGLRYNKIFTKGVVETTPFQFFVSRFELQN